MRQIAGRNSMSSVHVSQMVGEYEVQIATREADSLHRLGMSSGCRFQQQVVEQGTMVERVCSWNWRERMARESYRSW
jgi:hypothetical protein